MVIYLCLKIKIVKFQNKICNPNGNVCIGSWCQFCMKIKVEKWKKIPCSFVLIVLLMTFCLFSACSDFLCHFWAFLIVFSSVFMDFLSFPDHFGYGNYILYNYNLSPKFMGWIPNFSSLRVAVKVKIVYVLELIHQICSKSVQLHNLPLSNKVSIEITWK